MSTVWMISMILQWLLIAALSVLVLSLIRQLGTLTLQLNAIKETGGRDLLVPYSQVPSQEVTLIDGSQFVFGGTRERPCLVVLFSPTCGACQELPAAVRAFRENHAPSDMDFLVVIAAERAGAQRYLVEQSFGSIPVALRQDFPQSYFAGRSVPFAFGLTADGIVAAQGKPRNLRHLNEMAQACRHMADIATNHSVRKHEWGDSAPYWDINTNAQLPETSAAKAALAEHAG